MADIEQVDKSIRVLVVDDHTLTRTMVKAILRGLGFTHVQQAENGAAALDRLAIEPVDLVICDWNMPNFNGIELLRAVRSEEQFKDLPFLMLTAEAYRENVAAAIQAGVSDYMIKPFTAETLGQKVAGIMLRPRRK